LKLNLINKSLILFFLLKLFIHQNGNAGVRYFPRISNVLQRDIVSWLDRREQPELEANGIYIIPNNRLKRIQLFESQLDQRKFLVSKPTDDCSGLEK
jgi:hypothetical protein